MNVYLARSELSRVRSRRLGMALSLSLLFAACGGDETTVDPVPDESANRRGEIRQTAEETASITRCEMDSSTGVPVIDVELVNPSEQAWDFESITIGVVINDADGFFLADADAVFPKMEPGAATSKVTTSPSEFPDDTQIGECAVFDAFLN